MKHAGRRPAATSRRVLLVVLALVACALVVAACGGGSSSRTSTEATSTHAAAKPKGQPIVTLTYTDVNTQGPQQKDLAETQRVASEWINAHGGIAGRPLDAKFCDSRGTPTAAAACARQAVADKAVAVVGSFSFTGDAVVPILEKAGIADFGLCCPESASELSSPISFPTGNDPIWGAGLVQKAVRQGCKNINAAIIEGADAYKPLLANAAKANGTRIGKFVTLPATAGDYSPQVAEATSGGADCLIMIVAETAYKAWMPAFAQSGSKARMYGPEGNFSHTVVKGFDSVVQGDVVGGPYPDLSLPAWADFRQALKTYHAAPEDYDSLGGLGDWSAFQAFKQIVEGMKGPINNRTFLQAAKTAKINLPGMLPPLDLSRPWSSEGGPKGLGRIFNRCVAFTQWDGSGNLKALGNKLTDVSKLAGGTQPANCGPSFG
jgi:ABC-type branched-subunit amino acid transport system substrate-binding protein